MTGCNGCAGGNGGADVEVPLWIKPSLCWTRSRVVVIESEGIRDDRDGCVKQPHCWQTTADHEVADHEAGTT